MTFNSALGRRNAVRRAIAFCAFAAFTLGAAFAPGGAARADTTVSTATTTPLLTSTGGNITISSGGSITVTGATTAVTVDSDNSLTSNGAITAADANGVGVAVTAATTQGIVNTSTITTGTAQVLNSSNVVTTAAVGGGPAIHVSADLGLGINNTGTISTTVTNSSGNPYAVLIDTNGATTTIGNVDSSATAYDYSVYNGGTITATGYVLGDVATTVHIGGTLAVTLTGVNNVGAIRANTVDAAATTFEVGSLATLGNGTTTGLVNTGIMSATVVNNTTTASATVIHIANGGIVNTIDNSGSISASASTATGGTAGGGAIAIDVDPTGSLTTLTNSGSILASSSYDSTNATAIRDQSGTLTTVTNTSTGSITAAAGTTANPGTANAIDLSAATVATTVSNAGTISGNILFGSGDDTLTQTAGSITGGLSFGLGTNAFNMSGGTYSGAITSTGTDTITLSGGALVSATSTVSGTLDLIVNDASFRVASGDFNATTATFNTGSTLAAVVDPTGATSNGVLKTTGVTTFDTTSPTTSPTVSVYFTSYLAAPTSVTLADAASFNYLGGGSVSDLQIGGVGAGYIATLNDTGTEITLDLTRKTAAQIGFTGNLAAIYNAAPTALVADTAFGQAMGNLGTVAAIKAAYTQLLPDLSGAREMTAIRVQDVAAGFISDRLNLLRTADQGVGDGGGDYAGYKHRDAGFWVQEAVSAENSSGGTASPNYNGTMYVFSGGFDQRDGDGDVWGGSISYAALTFSTPVTPSDDLSQTVFAQIYHSLNRGPVFWDTMAGLGWNNYDVNRNVYVGSISRQTSASWMGYQGGLSSQVGYAANLGPVSVRPSVGASYTVLQQQGYTEKGGGQAVDLSINSNTFQSLRANAEVRISSIISAEPQFVPFFRGGISHELLDAKPKADGQFAAGGPSFSTEGDAINKDTPYVGLGLSAVGGFSRLTVEYTGMFGDRVTSHQAAATVSMAF